MGHLDGILNKSLGAIAAVVLIVGAGGGFKEMLLATKISELIGQWATQAHISPLLLGWGAAAVVRIATGSATVATITGAGIMAPIVQANPAVNKEPRHLQILDPDGNPSVGTGPDLCTSS